MKKQVILFLMLVIVSSVTTYKGAIVRILKCRVDAHCTRGKVCVNGMCVLRSQTNKNEKDISCNKRTPRVKRSPADVPDCYTNNDCPDEKACVKGMCENPCCSTTCGDNTICIVNNHTANCTCLPEVTGDPTIGCFISLMPRPPVPCSNNEHCPSEQSCISNNCENSCSIAKCGTNAFCLANNHKPKCFCPPQTEGNPDIGCIPVDKSKCHSNFQCPTDKACIEQYCVDLCTHFPCGNNAMCKSVDHIPRCSCNPGTVGDPYTNCSVVHNSQCHTNFQCSPDMACVGQYCVDLCTHFPCGKNAMCKSVDHIPRCSCNPGTVGDPYINCSDVQPPECMESKNCPKNKACINKKCEDSCSTAICGENAICETHNHQPKCSCISGSVGNPNISCKKKPEKKFYLVKNMTATWFQALDHCNEMGYNWRLASIETAEENAKVLHIIQETKIDYYHFWLAGTDKDYEGKWIWYTTGKPISGFTYWNNYEPNNFFEEDCLGYTMLPIPVFWKLGYHWNDFKCTDPYYFICEYYE